MNPKFWQGRRVFLTGHTGFKGSWLSLWLQQLGAQLTGYALAPPTNPSLFELAQVGTGMNSVIGDIRDLPALSQALHAAAPEVVIHMAAQPLVRLSYVQPVDTYATNVMGTVHLLEAVRHAPSVRAVLNVTTDKCYENRDWAWGYRESDPLGGHDPYSNSKACSELVSAAWRASFFAPQSYAQHGVALATARAGNVIGGGDWAADRLVPDVLHAFAQGTPVRLRNPHATRPWQHVLEPLRGYLMLCEQMYNQGPSYGDSWNFGPADTDARPVQWMVEQLAQRWGESATWEVDAGDHPHEASFLKLDTSRARSRLGWAPALDLSKALDLIMEWSQQWRAGRNMRLLTQQQISLYQSTERIL